MTDALREACERAARKLLDTAIYMGGKSAYSPAVEIDGFASVIEQEIRAALQEPAPAARQMPKCIDDWACMMPEDCPRHGRCLADDNPQAPVEPAPVVQPRQVPTLPRLSSAFTVQVGAPPAPSQLVEDAARYRTLLEYMTVARNEPGEWTCWLHLACIPFRSKTTDPAELVDKLVKIHAERSIAKGVES